jgi:hypothetical protein
MLKISSNHKHAAVKRHNLTAANKTMMRVVTIVAARNDLFLTVSFSVLTSDGVVGLDLITGSRASEGAMAVQIASKVSESMD